MCGRKAQQWPVPHCDDDMRSPLVRILADMVEAALESRNVILHASGHEEEGDVAAVPQPGVQGESVSQKAPRRAR